VFPVEDVSGSDADSRKLTLLAEPADGILGPAQKFGGFGNGQVFVLIGIAHSLEGWSKEFGVDCENV